MAHSNRTLQRLCIAGVSTATLIAGLPFLATAASAAHVTDVEFYSPFTATTITSNTDGTDTNSRLLVDAPASVVSVQYSYQVITPGAGGAAPTLGASVAIGAPVTARPFTADFNTLNIVNGTAIRITATGTNSAGGVVGTPATADVVVDNSAPGVNVTSPASTSGAGTTIGRFNGRVIVAGTVSPGFAGNVALSDILGPATGPAVGTTGVLPKVVTATPVNGAYSALVPTFSATNANAYINAAITSGANITDETELAAVYEQTVAAPALSPSAINSIPGGAPTNVTATVLDQNGKPVGGAIVNLDLNPADAATDGSVTTNTLGQATFSVPAPTVAGSRQISFIANQDQVDGLNTGAGDKATTVTQSTITPVVTTAAIASLDPTPSAAAPGTTAAPFPSFPAGTTSFDINEEDPEVRVNLRDQSGNAQAVAATVSYRVTFDPEGTNVVAGVDTLGPRRIDGGAATGYATGTSTADGFFAIPDNLIGSDAVTGGAPTNQGTYTVEAFVNKDGDAAPSAADTLATPVTYTFDGASVSSDAGATSQSEAGTATTRAFTYRLDNGTVLGGRLVNLTLANGPAGAPAAPAPATNLPAIFTATQPAGTTRTGDRSAYGVTDATTGKVTASVTDPASTSGTPAAQDQETVTLTAVAASSGRTAATDIAFIRGATPTVARLAAVQFPYGAQDATPGRPVTLTVKVDNGTAAVPGTSLAGQTVALSTDRGYFTSRANTAGAPVTTSDDGVLTPAQLVPATTPTGTGAQVGAYARNAAGKTLTTDAAGNVRFTVAIDKDTEFDNDGLATATVSVRVGNITRTLPVVFSTDAASVNNVALVTGDAAELDTTGDAPLNPAATNPLTIVSVPADSVVTNRPASAEDPGFQVVALDGFGNRAGYQVGVAVDNGTLDATPANGNTSTATAGNVDTSYTGDTDPSFTTSSSLAAFQTTGTTEATETQTITSAADVPTNTYADADGATTGFQFGAAAVTTGTARITDTQAVSYYSPLASAFTYAFASTPGNTVQIGTAVNTVVTVKDARGNAVSGLNARFIRSGPGDQAGDSFSGGQAVFTNANGQAGFTFTSATAGTATVTVIVTTNAGIELSRGVQNVTFTTQPQGNGTAPVISGAAQRFSPFGAPLTISGTATPGASVGIFFDRRGPETAKQVATVTATAAGTFSATFTPGDDYSVYAVTGNTASNTIVAFTSPTVSGPATQFGPRNGTIVLTGRGAPGSTLDISFRPQGSQSFSIKQRLTVGTNGVWTRPLSLRQNYAFYVQRSAGQNSPRTGIYVAAGR